MQFLSRYALTGILGTAVNIGLFWILVNLVGVWYLAASIAAFSARSLTKYSLLRFWVFKGKTGIRDRFRWFVGMEALGLMLGTALIYAFVEWFHLPHLLSLVLTISLLYVAMLHGSRHIFTKGSGAAQKGGRGI